MTIPMYVPRDHSMADWYHERLEKHISEFQDELADDEEMVIHVILNDGRSIRAAWFGYHNPNMIIVEGVDDAGREVKVLLPHIDTQVVLTKAKRAKGGERRQIGFQPRLREAQPAATGDPTGRVPPAGPPGS